jgi:16S rRNA (uracil1498-N3)-methyltransferase
MNRLFVPPEALGAEEVELDGALSHRLRHVLRMRKGDSLILLDGTGCEYLAALEEMDGPTVRARVLERRKGPPEPPVELILHQSLIKGDRFDWVLEKGTELGVARFVPLIAQRTVVRPRSDRHERGERWRRVVTEAAEQCGRSLLPEISPVTAFEDALDSASGLRLLLWEEERALGLRTALRKMTPSSARRGRRTAVSLFVGPEGGFTPEEVESARARGAQVVSLGPRILRSETAGITAAAAVLYEFGGLGE